MKAEDVKKVVRECGFELAGIARAAPLAEDNQRYLDWIERGMAGAMGYLTNRRATIRTDPRQLLPTARTIICAGKLYNAPQAPDAGVPDNERAWISRYAWGGDYHQVLRSGLEKVAKKLGTNHEYRICVDTAPLLERTYARQAGLGWIGKNTCMINQEMGSWFFLGEILTSLELEPDSPPPDRCGTCTRCIDACPTNAIAPEGYEVDARRCIAYFTIELRGPVPREMRRGIGQHVFGCDVCQDVCPWNRHAPVTSEAAFQPRPVPTSLETLAAMSEEEFREVFRGSPVLRSKYQGFLRNVAIAMGNSKVERFREPLEKLAQSPNEMVQEHARWALKQLDHPKASDVS